MRTVRSARSRHSYRTYLIREPLHSLQYIRKLQLFQRNGAENEQTGSGQTTTHVVIASAKVSQVAAIPNPVQGRRRPRALTLELQTLPPIVSVPSPAVRRYVRGKWWGTISGRVRRFLLLSRLQGSYADNICALLLLP